MKITKHAAVTIHYRLSDEQGLLIENSFDSEPMVYLHGTENLIPGLESVLEGKTTGEKVEADIPAEQAYGEYHPGLKQEVPVSAFGDVEDIVPGMRFIAETEMGQRPVQVIEVKDDVIVVDGNHPLAGQSLHFSVEVIAVREATAEELSHGHIHAEGGCGSHAHGHDHDDGSCGTEKPGCDGNGGCGCR
ncbi:peptidylprolyl isomerase [Shewanella livingstonensis]|uniref:Peptidyl-prolyl cis-trans isomerase n=1 Tax=Shewanella livingstonensis TaxID=150120 RepID=A0A3G8LYS0_9GAMM|nr:peptidylprolyl isomerase [Shewanella livingstonensis]AZG74245.1 peptidylprolyl isomerase [Shewanella livingstonensis]